MKTKIKKIKSIFGYCTPCIYEVSMRKIGFRQYTVMVNATDKQGHILNEKPIYSNFFKNWIKAYLNFREVYKEYEKKVNGKDSILFW